MLQTFNFSTARQIDASGNFLRYEQETSQAADTSVSVLIDGQNIGTMLPGDSIELERQFTRVEIVPVAGAQGLFRVGRGRVQSSRVTLGGNVITAQAFGPRSAWANTAGTVGTASAQLVAANPSRRYLHIQNGSQTEPIFIRFGAAATTTTGFRLGPGSSFETDAACPDNAVHAISTAAGVPVVIVEG